MDVLKNPVVVGVIAGVITYIILYYKDKNEKDPKIKQKYIGLTIPAIVALIIWFISGSYFETTNIQKSSINELMLMGGNEPFLGDINDLGNLSLSNDAKSVNIINNGVSIPTKLPDVFIETI